MHNSPTTFVINSPSPIIISSSDGSDVEEEICPIVFNVTDSDSDSESVISVSSESSVKSVNDPVAIPSSSDIGSRNHPRVDINRFRNYLQNIAVPYYLEKNKFRCKPNPYVRVVPLTRAQLVMHDIEPTDDMFIRESPSSPPP